MTCDKKLFDIARTVINEAIGFGFSLGTLKEMWQFSKKVGYCKEYLGEPIGNGSARMVFQLDDHWVLKLAKNAKGLAQNEHEGRRDWFRDSYGIFPEVNYGLSDMDDYTYIVSEYVLPVRETDFKKCLAISSGEFYDFLRKCAETYMPRSQYGIRVPMSNTRFNELLEENEPLNQWYDYISNYQMAPNDLRNANFGLANRDGDPAIVMLDNGVNEEIMNQYYRKVKR